MITVGQLIACGVLPNLARQFVDPLNASMALYSIDSPARIAAFLAQAMHESSGFSKTEESLFYRTPERIREVFPSRVSSLGDAAALCGKPEALANRVYSERMGNGDEASGDGWKFRGRGVFQLTGRHNYADAALELNRPYLDRPELVSAPSDACLTAAWYWHCNKLNILADASNTRSITRAINGKAMLGLHERIAQFDRNMQVFA